MNFFYIFDIFFKMSYFFLLKIVVLNSVMGKSKLMENVKIYILLGKRVDVIIF